MLKQTLDIIRCPDDGDHLLQRGMLLECVKCKRVFNVLSENMVELLPKQPYKFNESISQQYLESYSRLFEDRFEWKSSAQGWGDISKASRGTKSFVMKERNIIEGYLSESAHGNFCDVSGGAGNYSLHFANIG